MTRILIVLALAGFVAAQVEDPLHPYLKIPRNAETANEGLLVWIQTHDFNLEIKDQYSH